MRVLWFVRQLSASRKQAKRTVPNAQPFLLWTQESGEWREMKVRARS